MIILKNVGQKDYLLDVTKCPISAPHKSPNPDPIQNPENPNEKIPNPDMLTETDKVILRAGETIKFGEKERYNEEQGEYIYWKWGTKEDGGLDITKKKVTNKNYILEVDKEGVETKENLFKKYRTVGSSTPFSDMGLKVEQPEEPKKERVEELAKK